MKRIFSKGTILLVVFISLLVISGCTVIYHHYPFSKVRDIQTIETRLRQAVSKSSRLKMEVAGQINYSDHSLPVWLITYTPSARPRHHAFVTAGIHGNEPAGVEAVVSLIEEIGHNELNLPAVQIEFMPLLNPWGWERNQKWNGDAIDVNRKFIKVMTQESTIIRKIIHKKRYDITIDLHEDGRYEGFYCRLHATEKAYLFETPFDRKFEDRIYLHKTSILYLVNNLGEYLVKILEKNDMH